MLNLAVMSESGVAHRYQAAGFHGMMQCRTQSSSHGHCAVCLYKLIGYRGQQGLAVNHQLVQADDKAFVAGTGAICIASRVHPFTLTPIQITVKHIII